VWLGDRSSFKALGADDERLRKAVDEKDGVAFERRLDRLVCRAGFLHVPGGQEAGFQLVDFGGIGRFRAEDEMAVIHERLQDAFVDDLCIDHPVDEYERRADAVVPAHGKFLKMTSLLPPKAVLTASRFRLSLWESLSGGGCASAPSSGGACLLIFSRRSSFLRYPNNTLASDPDWAVLARRRRRARKRGV
jgi:hypothetical protein